LTNDSTAYEAVAFLEGFNYCSFKRTSSLMELGFRDFYDFFLLIEIY